VRDRFPLVLICGLLLAGALGAFLLKGASRGDFADTLSTYRASATGARALFLLAQESGLPVVRRTQDLSVLEGTHGVVLLGVDVAGAHDTTPEETELVDGAETGVSSDEAPRDGLNLLFVTALEEREVEALLEHVSRGATLVYAPWGARENPLLDAVGVQLRKASPELGVRTLVPAQVTPFTRGVERVEAPVQSFLRLPEGAVPLLVDPQLDAPVAALALHGEGRVLVLGAPELAANEHLARADNAVLWLELLGAAARGGPVHFDEYHHGFRNERSVVDFARRYGLHFAVAQLLLGLLLWAASLRRFGAPQALAEEVRVGGADALSASARLYRAGRHHAWAAGLLLRELAQSLGRTVGAGSHATPAEVEAALRVRGREDLAAALARTAQLAAGAQREADVVATATEAARSRRLAHPLAHPAPGRTDSPASPDEDPTP
jgi:hypothetical protein